MTKAKVPTAANPAVSAIKTATTTTATPRAPRKLTPRTAPKPVEVAPETVVDEVVSPPLAESKAAEDAAKPVAAKTTPAAAPKKTTAAKPRAPRKPSKEDETVAKHQKVLAEALVEAEAISYEQPVMMSPKVSKAKKIAKAPKVPKVSKSEVKPVKTVKSKDLKLIRDCFAMPDVEYAQIASIKKRMAAIGQQIKKSEVIRAGVAVLAALNSAELKAVMAHIERIKVGRPSKK